MIDCSIPLNTSLSAFGVPPITIEHSWSKCRKDSVNADTIKSFCPHLHGTHTESIFHIIEKEDFFQHEMSPEQLVCIPIIMDVAHFFQILDTGDQI